MLSPLNNSLELITIEVHYTLEIEYMHFCPLLPNTFVKQLKELKTQIHKVKQIGDKTPDK